MMMIVFLLLFWFFLGWIMICNFLTYKQRIDILDSISTIHDYKEYARLMDCFDKVSYDKHFLSVVTFRNPKKLYQHGLGKFVNDI